MKGKDKAYHLLTSESVTEGHPDKVCDQLSDAILDAYLAKDEKARVAVETMVSANTVMVAGEVTSKAEIDISKIVREVIGKIGYTEPGKGFDANSCMILTNIHNQSEDISRGVTKKQAEGEEEKIGGGDQGIMYGFATDETPHLMPLTWDLANKLTMQLSKVRKEGKADFLYPDGKSQVTMFYEGGKPVGIHSVIVSAQHSERVPKQVLETFIKQEVIEPVMDQRLLTDQTKIYINPTGRFVIGGPSGDVGVTGRKIMVDTYGTISKHGGGAFSGKDPTKVDRSGAYMARYVAKNIVAAGLAKKCEVSLAYVIGSTQPEAIYLETFGTETIERAKLNQMVRRVFSFEVADILRQLDLRKPQYLKTAAYGHFGRENQAFKWEEKDKVYELIKYAMTN